MRYEGTDDENYHRCCLTLLYVDDTIIHGWTNICEFNPHKIDYTDIVVAQSKRDDAMKFFCV